MLDARNKTKAGIEYRVSRINFSLLSKYVAAFSASLLLAFSPIFWSQAVVAEFFTLNTFFLALLIYLLIIWREKVVNNDKASARFFYLFAFFFGLGLGNHQTLFFAFPGFAYFIWMILKEQRAKSKEHREKPRASAKQTADRRRPKPMAYREKQNTTLCPMPYAPSFLLFIIFFLLGLSIYLYLPIRSLSNPVIDWGNPENLRNFWRVITRADYGTLKLAKESSQARDLGLFFRQMWAYLYAMAKQFSVVGMLLALIGIWHSFKLKKQFTLLLLLIFLSTGPIFVFLSNLPYDPNSLARLERFYLLSSVVLALWVGYGLYSLSIIIKRTPVMLILLFLPVLSLLMHYNMCNQSKNFFAYDYGINILNTLEKDALLFSKKDNTRNIIWYLQLVEGKRPDVKNVVLSLSHWWANYLIDNNPDLELGLGKGIAGEKKLVEFIAKSNVKKFPIYIDAFAEVVSPSFYDFWIPNGILFRFYGKDREAIGSAIVKRENDEVWSKYVYGNRYKITEYEDFFIQETVNRYAGAHFNLGNYYYGNGQYDYAEEEYKKAIEIGLYEDEKSIKPTSYPAKRNLAGIYYIKKEYDKAVREYEELIDIKPEEVPLYNFLASAHYNRGRYEKAIETYEKALEIDPFYIEVWNNLGLVYYSQGNLEKAKEMFKRALSLDSEYKNAKDNYEMVERKLQERN